MSFKTFDIGAPLSGRLGEALGTGLKSGYENLQKRLLEREKQQGKAVTPEQAAQLTQTLTQQGMDPRLAQLYPYLTTGGQTKAAEFGVENIMRKESSSPLGSFQDETGLTPKEKIARQKERYTTGLKIYQEGMQKLRGLEANSDRFEILNKLNKSNKLPENLGRINVDKRGNLKVPFISTPEAERYIKTLNEFTANAKDTYGSRVTNFELDQYLKRFPTLLNSQEGRNQVLQQMKIVNEINKEYYKNLKNIYKQAGGVRNIDADVAESLAEDMSAPRIEKLREKFDEIGMFTSIPEASQFKGKKIRNKETGEILISDGIEWIPQG